MRRPGAALPVWWGPVLLLGVGAFAGCSTPYLGTTAASYLKTIRTNDDPNLRYYAYRKLASLDCYDTEAEKKQAALILIDRLEKKREPVASRAEICRTLGVLGRPEARRALRNVINQDNREAEEVIRSEACRALGRLGDPYDATLLSQVMTLDNDPDTRLAAIEGLGALKSHDPRITGTLVQGMRHESPAIRLACLEALRATVGRDLGTDPAAWEKYLISMNAAAAPAAPARPAPAAGR